MKSVPSGGTLQPKARSAAAAQLRGKVMAGPTDEAPPHCCLRQLASASVEDSLQPAAALNMPVIVFCVEAEAPRHEGLV